VSIKERSAIPGPANVRPDAGRTPPKCAQRFLEGTCMKTEVGMRLSGRMVEFHHGTDRPDENDDIGSGWTMFRT